MLTPPMALSAGFRSSARVDHGVLEPRHRVVGWGLATVTRALLEGARLPSESKGVGIANALRGQQWSGTQTIRPPVSVEKDSMDAWQA